MLFTEDALAESATVPSPCAFSPVLLRTAAMLCAPGGRRRGARCEAPEQLLLGAECGPVNE